MHLRTLLALFIIWYESCFGNCMKKKIIDTTLRDGEQAPGIVFTAEQRKRTAAMLAESGVDEIEAGAPVMGESDVEFLRWCGGLGITVSGWCRADLRDIEAAKRAGLKAVHISLPASDRLLTVFGKTRGWAELKLLEYKNICSDEFDRVSIGFMDATRADRRFLGYLVKLAELLGYDRIRLADTAGVMHPVQVAELVGCFRDYRADIEFHPHNDLGMATANAVTALDSGADAVSATVLGIGERAGNARLEEIALAMKLDEESFKDGEKQFNFKVLKKLCAYIGEITNITPAFNKAVVGENVFNHETGIHAAATLKDPLSFMPVVPEEIGLGRSEIITGRHSGTRSIQHTLQKYSINIDRETAAGILPLVRKEAERTGSNIKSSELEAIYHEYISCSGS